MKKRGEGKGDPSDVRLFTPSLTTLGSEKLCLAADKSRRPPRISVATQAPCWSPPSSLMLQATLRHPVRLAELSSNGPNTELQLLSLSGEMSERRPAGRVSSPSPLPDKLLTQNAAPGRPSTLPLRATSKLEPTIEL
jgi:hypothetical protein